MFSNESQGVVYECSMDFRLFGTGSTSNMTSSFEKPEGKFFSALNTELISIFDIDDSSVYPVFSAKEFSTILEVSERGQEILLPPYEDILKKKVSNVLFFLSKNIDTLPLPELKKRWKLLIDNWKPILDKYFSNQISSLASHIVDRLR